MNSRSTSLLMSSLTASCGSLYPPCGGAAIFFQDFRCPTRVTARMVVPAEGSPASALVFWFPRLSCRIWIVFVFVLPVVWRSSRRLRIRLLDEWCAPGPSLKGDRAENAASQDRASLALVTGARAGLSLTVLNLCVLIGDWLSLRSHLLLAPCNVLNTAPPRDLALVGTQSPAQCPV